MAPPDPSPTQNTPLAPSVEKAYYRKCIELKRRLNQVESANDDLKLRRVRLDRAITKMRLERAFLLEQLSKRMAADIDGSEGSDDGMTTSEPPPERPHRDKRRRTTGSTNAHSHPSAGAPPAPTSAQHSPYVAPANRLQRLPSSYDSQVVRPMVPGPNGEMVVANALNEHGAPVYLPPDRLAALHETANAGSEYGPAATTGGSAPLGVPGATAAQGTDMDGADDERGTGRLNRGDGVAGEALSAGPATREDANGERRVVGDGDGDGDAGGGFTAVNQ